MQRYRTVIILALLVVLPLVVAVVAARFLLQQDPPEPAQVESPPAEAPPAVKPPETRRVLAAARKLPVGALLTEEDLIELELVAREVRSGHIVMDGTTSADVLRGFAVREALAAGTPVTRSAVVGPGQRGFLAAALKPDTRAVTIRLGPGMSYAGLIDPGDRVDVILTAKLRTASGAESVLTRTILENVRVVAVDHQVGTSPKSGEYGEQVERTPIVTATLEVSPAQADRLVLGEHEGSLSLAVRSLAAVQPTRAEAVNLSELLRPPTVPETRRVLVAARALPAGTLLREEDLSELELRTEDVGRGHFVADGIASVGALRGFAVRKALGAGDPLTRSSVVGPGQQGFLAVVLGPETRAVTIRPGSGTSQTGLIDPGDRVDVILTAEVPLAGDAKGVFTRTVLENVRVVAMDRHVGNGAPASQSGDQVERTGIVTATLEVSPAQADLLAHGEHEGTLSLAARPSATAAGGSQRHSIATEPVLAPRKTVRIIRGGELTEQIFLDPQGRSSSSGKALPQ